MTYYPARRITAEDGLKHEYFRETPLPIDPSMFPTWPAKSEQQRVKRGTSPRPPEGGLGYSQLVSMARQQLAFFAVLPAMGWQRPHPDVGNVHMDCVPLAFRGLELLDSPGLAWQGQHESPAFALVLFKSNFCSIHRIIMSTHSQMFIDLLLKILQFLFRLNFF